METRWLDESQDFINRPSRDAKVNRVKRGGATIQCRYELQKGTLNHGVRKREIKKRLVAFTNEGESIEKANGRKRSAGTAVKDERVWIG